VPQRQYYPSPVLDIYNEVMHWVYMLYNPSTGKYYTGETNNLKRRLSEHRRGNNQSTKHKYADWRLVYAELHVDQNDARIRETKLKSHGSGIVEIRKRIKNSLEVVSKTGDGERWKVAG